VFCECSHVAWTPDNRGWAKYLKLWKKVEKKIRWDREREKTRDGRGLDGADDRLRGWVDGEGGVEQEKEGQLRK
jgi:hypothetical protein